MNIDEPSTAATPFDTLGGESQVLALAERFYDLMDLEPSYAALRAAHGSTLAQARQKLFWYLCGWLGGPQHYTERFGHPLSLLVVDIDLFKAVNDAFGHLAGRRVICGVAQAR
eukprot:gene2921-3840_t